MGKRIKGGYFITFEGAEGSGKSTQIRLAARYLKRKGFPVVLFREPGGTRVSEAIRKTLLDRRLKEMAVETELLLYLAARSQLVREKIGPALQKGKVVILDRYEDSTLAYQGFAGGISLKKMEAMNRFTRGRFVPQLTFLLDVGSREGLRRSGRRDRVEQKPVSFHERVRKGFLQLARREPRRFIVLPSREPIAQVRKKVEEALSARF